MSTPFDVTDMLSDLDAGLFVRKISRALADTALAVTTQDGKAKKGRVTIEIDITRMAESGNQVMMSHKLAYSRPTRRGKSSEEDTTETPMYVSGVRCNHPAAIQAGGPVQNAGRRRRSAR